MSLRGRVIALVGLVLLTSLGIDAVLAWNGARIELAEELAAARRVGVQTVRSGLADLPRSARTARDLHQLIRTFDGNRHLRAVLVDREGHSVLASHVPLPGAPAPDWFARSLAPDLAPTKLDVAGGQGMRLELRPEPASDVAAAWAAAITALALFAGAAALALALIHYVIGRALMPLADLSRGLEAIGATGGEPIREAGPPELRHLQRGFNAMADRLAQADAHNRALEAQVLTIQDEERAEIARDLHDEIGPHLFAVALDAGMIARSLEERGEPVPEQLRSIQSAVGYMQRQVRELLARLRPTRAAELGLGAAITDLVRFWQQRQPEISFDLRIERADTIGEEALRDVIYRIVQEALANALRHADTTEARITLAVATEEIAVEVGNKGAARAAGGGTPGLGLAGMRERVSSAGGTLHIDRAAGGWTVLARFPVTGVRGRDGAVA